jgi:hypothetical protein
MGNESLPPSARKRAEDELARRKAEDRRTVVAAGILIGTEGATPQQVSTMSEWWEKAKVTEVHVPSIARGRGLLMLFPEGERVHTYRRSVDRDELREVVVHADTLVALPPRIAREGNVWWAVGHAHHRKVPVTVILPDGTIN